MRKNVGTIDASIRITLGLLGLAYGIGKMSRRNGRAPWALMMLSAMKVAEGITRYCPMLDAAGISTHEGKELMNNQEKSGATMLAKTIQNMVKPEAAKANPTLSPAEQQIQNDLQEHLASQGFATSPGAGAAAGAGTTTTETETAGTTRPSDAYRDDEHVNPTYS